MTVTDDLALLVHTATGRRLVDRATLARLLAGAQLVDLVAAGRVALAGRGYQVVHRVSTGDAVLDVALDRLPEAGSIPTAISTLRRGAVERVMAHLVAAGAVRSGRRRVCGVVPVASWPSRDPARRAALVAGLRSVLLEGAGPTDAEVALVALIDAARALPAVVDGPRRAVRARAAEIADDDRVGAATRAAVTSARAVRLAVLASAGASAG